jgi:hypothetical protein
VRLGEQHGIHKLHRKGTAVRSLDIKQFSVGPGKRAF